MLAISVLVAACGDDTDSQAPIVTPTPSATEAQHIISVAYDGGTRTLTDVAVEVDRNDGTIYAAWAESVSPTESHLFVATSADGGVTFGEPVSVTEDTNARMPDFKSDNNGSFYVAWSHFDGAFDADAATPAGAQVFLTHSHNNGRSFGHAVAVAPRADSVTQLDPALATADFGQTVVVTWKEAEVVQPSSPGSIMSATSHDLGHHFAASQGVGVPAACPWTSLTIGEQPALVVVVPGAAAAGTASLVRTNSDKETWGDPVPLGDAAKGSTACARVGADVDATGLLHAVWTVGEPRSYMYVSSADGVVFTEPLAVPAPALTSPEGPRVTVDEKGTRWIASAALEGSSDRSGIWLQRIVSDGKPESVFEEDTPGSLPDLAVGPGGGVLAWLDGSVIIVHGLGAF